MAGDELQRADAVFANGSKQAIGVGPGGANFLGHTAAERIGVGRRLSKTAVTTSPRKGSSRSGGASETSINCKYRI